MIEVFNIQKGLFYGILNLKTLSTQHNITNKRELEQKGRDTLLRHLLGDKAIISYNEKGKPYLLDDSRHISISHSHDKLAIVVNETESTGIDIELIRDKILNIKHKFLSDKELLEINDDVEKMLVYWAAKETMYKVYGLKEVDFIKNLFVNPFSKSNLGTIIGEINMPNYNHKFNLLYKIEGGYVLVVSLKKL